MLLSTVLNTAAILASIRTKMGHNSFGAYIVPYTGQHYSESTAPCEERIAAISRFTGSAARVIITMEHALLWTDGRYFLQAEQQLDENWTLMKDGQPGVLSESDWLKANLTEGDRVAVDASLYPKSLWDKMTADLKDAGITLHDEHENYVDAALPDHPACPANAISDFPLQFSGKSVADKLVQIREKMESEGAQLLLVSELEEIAWLFNLRGADLPPVFYAYATVRVNAGAITALLILKDVSLPDGIEAALNAANVEVVFDGYKNAEQLFKEEVDMVNSVWVSKYANAGMANHVDPNEKRLILKLSPLALLKAIKNPIEVDGMRSAHLRDSAAIIAFFNWIQTQIVNNSVADITEISAAEKLLEFRALAVADPDAHFVSASFSTISGYGANGAIVHYRPTPETNAVIKADNLYLVDSGGQYLQGTTDITRTVHLGTPSQEQRDKFTRVLKGHIAVATSTFPKKTTGHRLDALARQFLWDAKVDYNHGTGHGIGHYLGVHEGPQSMSYTVAVDDTGLEANMFISNEPGYYEAEAYGIRLENIVRVAEIEGNSDFLQFETVSFVPIQLSLIDQELMTREEIAWLDDYHEQCRTKVSALVNSVTYFEDKEGMLRWLSDATKPLAQFNGGSKVLLSTFAMISAIFLQTSISGYLA